MFDSYNKNLEETIAKYPWINMMTASEAGETLARYEEAKVYIDKREDAINGYINNFREDMYFIVRTHNEIDRVVNGESIYIDDNTYIMHVTAQRFSVVMKK